MAKKNQKNIAIDNSNFDAQQNLSLKEILSNANVPYWWQIDLPVSATDKEIKAVVDDLSSKKASVLQQIDFINVKRTALIKAIGEDEAEFLKLKAAQDDINRLKEEEIALYEKQIIEEKEMILAEKTKELEALRHDEEMIRLNAEALKRQMDIKAESISRQEEIERRVADVTKQIATKKQEKDEITKTFEDLQQKREELYPLSSKIKDYAGEYIVKHYEKYDPDNILEIVDVCLFDKSQRKYVLHTPIINVRRNRLTVVSSTESSISLISKLLHRTLGSNFNVCSGEVRFEGENMLSTYREDFNKKFQGKMHYFSILFEQLLNSEKNIYDTLLLDRKDTQFSLFSTMLDIGQGTLNKKGIDMTESEVALAVLCYLFSRKGGLIILEKAFSSLNPADYEKAMDVINANTVEATVLVLTSNTKTALRFYDSKFYNF